MKVSVRPAKTQKRTVIICLFQVQERYDTSPPVLFHAERRAKGGKFAASLLPRDEWLHDGGSREWIAEENDEVRVNRVSFRRIKTMKIVYGTEKRTQRGGRAIRIKKGRGGRGIYKVERQA